MLLFLGTLGAFRRVYEQPIVDSRQPGASKEQVSLGEQRGAELNRMTTMFVLRRTQDINNKYLPTKRKLHLFKYTQYLLTRLVGSKIIYLVIDFAVS